MASLAPLLSTEAALGRPLPPMIRQGQLSYLHDDLVSLAVFHRRIIEQSFQRVFSSGLSPYGVTVVAR